jgi:Lhr-like helicase
MIWITPLRSLSKDIAKAMQEAIDEIGLDWAVGVEMAIQIQSTSATGQKYA